MLCAKDDLALHLGGETRKVVAVAADTNYQIAVGVGVESCALKESLIRNVDLKLEASARHIDLDQRAKGSEGAFGIGANRKP